MSEEASSASEPLYPRPEFHESGASPIDWEATRGPGGTILASRTQARITSGQPRRRVARMALDPASDDPTPNPLLDYVLSEARVNELTTNPEFRAALLGALDGSLPYDYPLTHNQPAKLNPRSIQIVLLRIAGYTNKEIAQFAQYTASYVSQVMGHPYSRRLVMLAGSSALAEASAHTRRLRRGAPRMLKVIRDIALDETAEAPARLRAAFGWLEQANISPSEQKIAVEHKHSGGVVVTHKRSELIATAIREATAPKEIIATLKPTGTEGA